MFIWRQVIRYKRRLDRETEAQSNEFRGVKLKYDEKVKNIVVLIFDVKVLYIFLTLEKLLNE